MPFKVLVSISELTTFLTVCLSVCQDAEGLPVEVKVRSKSDGLYSCSYMPTSSLKHTVAVTWGGVSIPNSPFRVSSQSQHSVKTVRDIPPKSEDLVEAQSAKVALSEPLIKTESTKIFKSELIAREESLKMVQSKCKDATSKTRKPLIIITTCTEERYSF